MFKCSFFIQAFELFFNIHVIPLWPAINTSWLGFELHAGAEVIDPVCFAIELTGCLSSNGKCSQGSPNYVYHKVLELCSYETNICLADLY